MPKVMLTKDNAKNYDQFDPYVKKEKKRTNVFPVVIMMILYLVLQIAVICYS